MRQERLRKWEDETEKRNIREEKAHPCAVLSQNNIRSSQGQCPGAGKRWRWSLGQRSYLQGRIMPNATLPARRSGWGSPVASCSLHFLPGGNRIQPQANLEARWKAVP